MTTYRGYMVEADFDGTTLTMQGTNKAGRVALAGEDHGAGPVRLSREQITGVALKDASMLVNGNLRVSAGAKTYQLHFRKKQAADFQALHAALS